MNELIIKKKYVQTVEAMLSLKRQQAEATTIQVEQDFHVQKENQQCEIEVAEQNC